LNKSTAIGWLGTVLILTAYGLNEAKILTINSTSYQILNIVGGIGVAIVSWKKKAYPPLFLNASWSVLAVITLLIIIF